MSEDAFRTVQHALEPKFLLQRKGLRDYVLLGPWGFGLYLSELSIAARSGCCGMLLSVRDDNRFVCEKCFTPSSAPFPLVPHRVGWAQAREWLEAVLVAAGYDVLEATLEASVLADLAELLSVTEAYRAGDG